MNFIEQQESVLLPPVARFHISKLEDKYREQVLAMASTLVSLLDLKDCYTGGHSTRVATYSRLIALELNLDETEMETIVMAASLHDIGKIGVPDHILLKPGKLTTEEFEHIKKHSEFGWMVLRNIEGFEEASMMLLHHHERFGGGGYPGDLQGHQIPLGARIIAVGDTFDAITTDRSYRAGRSEEEAIAEIVRCKQKQFDPIVVDAFCSAMGY
jgi:HD-GYP domain-containing protein (c-di-GMP phosphodiesterase class II)